VNARRLAVKREAVMKNWLRFTMNRSAFMENWLRFTMNGCEFMENWNRFMVIWLRDLAPGSEEPEAELALGGAGGAQSIHGRS
jgi:hypothetical protein